MTACPEMDTLLMERASGEMASEDAARVDAHLETCEACRSELRAYQDMFELARLPPAEPRLAELDVSTFSAYQRRRRRRVASLTLGAGLVAAMVAASVVIAPAFLTLRSLPQQQHTAAVDSPTYRTATIGGQVALASETTDELAPEDVALAAFDEAEP